MSSLTFQKCMLVHLVESNFIQIKWQRAGGPHSRYRDKIVVSPGEQQSWQDSLYRGTASLPEWKELQIGLLGKSCCKHLGIHWFHSLILVLSKSLLSSPYLLLCFLLDSIWQNLSSMVHT